MFERNNNDDGPEKQHTLLTYIGSRRSQLDDLVEIT